MTISTDAPARSTYRFTNNTTYSPAYSTPDAQAVGLYARAVRAVLADDVHGLDRVADAVAGVIGHAVDDVTFSVRVQKRW